MAPFESVIRHVYAYPLVCRMERALIIIQLQNSIPVGEGSLCSIPVHYLSQVTGRYH